MKSRISRIQLSLKTASLVVKKQYCRQAEYHFISPRKAWERLLCIDQRDVFPVSPRHINLMYLYSVFKRGPFPMVGQVIACNYPKVEVYTSPKNDESFKSFFAYSCKSHLKVNAILPVFLYLEPGSRLDKARAYRFSAVDNRMTKHFLMQIIYIDFENKSNFFNQDFGIFFWTN